MTLLQIGRRTGLLDAVLAEGGTAQEIGDRAGADHRNADEWLRGMTVAGYLTHSDGRFDATRDDRGRPSGPVPVLRDLDPGRALGSAAGVRRRGRRSAVRRRYPGERLAPYAPFVGVNTPTYEMALVEDWIAAVPGLSDTLTGGARVAEVAPGNGSAAAVLGRAFPSSTVVGYDLSPQTLPNLPANVSIRAADARDLPGEGPFDLVYCLDALHHMSDPASVLQGVHRALAPEAWCSWPRTTSPATSTRTPRTQAL